MSDHKAQAERLLADWCGMSGAIDNPGDPIRPEFIELLAEAMSAAEAKGRRAALEECLKFARGTKEDGHTLAAKAHAEGAEREALRWSGEAEGAAEIERDIMNLLGIDWANGETEPRALLDSAGTSSKSTHKVCSDAGQVCKEPVP